MSRNLTEEDIAAILVNPVYAITIDPDLAGVTQHLITKEVWIAAQVRLIEEMGSEAYVKQLVAVLEGEYPRNPE